MVLKDFACHSASDPFYEGMNYLKKLNWTEEHDTFLAAKFPGSRVHHGRQDQHL